MDREQARELATLAEPNRIAGARQLAPHQDERMLGAQFMEQPVFLHELFPQD